MRNRKIDNIKGVLILLVVFGHLLEMVLKNTYAREIYICIYMFHMPVFIFTTGYFAKWNGKKLVEHLLYPYIVFSILYQLCAVFVWKDLAKADVTTPYWLLWYLFATMIWMVTLPLWQKKSKAFRRILFAVSIVVACVIGFCDGIGREMSLSRIFVFFPFFIAGVNWHREEAAIEQWMHSCKRVWKVVLVLCIIGLFVFLGWKSPEIRRTWTYEATPFSTSKYTLAFRCVHIAVGFVMVFATMLLIPSQKVPMLSFWGEHTMSIFLLHGFIIKWLSFKNVAGLLGLEDKKTVTVIICLITATAIVTILSSKLVRRISEPLFSFPFRR